MSNVNANNISSQTPNIKRGIESDDTSMHAVMHTPAKQSATLTALQVSRSTQVGTHKKTYLSQECLTHGALGHQDTCSRSCFSYQWRRDSLDTSLFDNTFFPH